MSAALHTPGPWAFTQGEYLYVNGKDAEGKRAFILQRDFRTQSKANQERIVADCRLIAAAPDMLAALRTAEHSLSAVSHPNCDATQGDPLHTIRAAIAKATGSAA